MIETEIEMTGEVAKTLRTELGLRQTAFWHAVGIKQAGGCRYELGQVIPRPVRILLFARYVVGLPLDATTPEGVAVLHKLAKHAPKPPTVAQAPTVER